MSQFHGGLKSRSDEVRLRTARELQKFVSTELRELPPERYGSTLDEINQVIFSLISSPEVHEKKGGILAIGEGGGAMACAGVGGHISTHVGPMLLYCTAQISMHCAYVLACWLCRSSI